MGLEDRILQRLNHKKHWDLWELSEELQADFPEVYGVIRRLERQGIIKIMVGEDEEMT